MTPSQPKELPPLIAGLGPQVALLITTQQGAEIRAEVERWLPMDAILEVVIHGLTPAEGRELVESVAGRPLAEAEWELVREIGELVGWHPEALRLAAIEGREIGWVGMLYALRAGRMPWDKIKRQMNRQRARLDPDQQDWLKALLQCANLSAGFTIDEAARVWQTETAIAERRFHILGRTGLVTNESNTETVRLQWQITPMARLSANRDDAAR